MSLTMTRQGTQKHTCQISGQSFEISAQEQAICEKVSPEFGSDRFTIPLPTLSPEERHRLRYAQRNERNLYRRTCDLTGAEIISFYRPSIPYTIYSHDAWWSDRWDPLTYGREVDFSRPFFEQFDALRKAVPRMGMVVHTCENCDYAPYSVRSKNCYMCPSCKESEDLCYCYQTHFSRDCIDCSLCWKLELCYECLYCTGLFQCAFCKDCENSNDLLFCEDCRSCKNCIGCKNLVNKEYHILNQRVSRDEYERQKKSLSQYGQCEKWRTASRNFILTLPTRAAHLINCEQSSGDHLLNCKNAEHCFDSNNLEDCCYGYTSPGGVRDCMDFDYSPGAELCYLSLSVVDSYKTLFALHSWQCRHVIYTEECFSCEHLFGCIGLRNTEYCILNKRYPKEEYENLCGKLIAHMDKTGEWGHFFPVNISPFAYNETIAQNWYPLSREEAFTRTYRWIDPTEEIPKVQKTIPAERLPEEIAGVPDDVLNWAITCVRTKKPFRIVRQELTFYRRLGLPIPHLHPEERYSQRMALSNPRQLVQRACVRCGKETQTTYTPTRPEKVYCESCYLKTVY